MIRQGSAVAIGVALAPQTFLTVASESRLVTANTVQSFDVRIPVQDRTYLFEEEGSEGYYLDVAAVVETDADGDGYGDDTQDGCPTDARTTGKCAETTIKKAPKKTVLTAGESASVKIKFRGADPAGTFKCAVDSKKFKKCKAPLKGTFGLGKHKVLIEAINARGVVELEPATVTFKVVKKR